MIATMLLAISASPLHSAGSPDAPEQQQVRAVIQQFEQGLRDRDLAKSSLLLERTWSYSKTAIATMAGRIFATTICFLR